MNVIGELLPDGCPGRGDPEKNGKKRLLGIPTIEDCLAQMVVKLELEPEVDKAFCEDSYGYRPDESSRNDADRQSGSKPGGKDVTNLPTKNIFAYGVGHIPEDRLGMAVADVLPLFENTSLYTYDTVFYCKRGLVDWNKEREACRQLITTHGIVAANETVSLRTLSGQPAMRNINAWWLATKTGFRSLFSLSCILFQPFD